MKTPSIYISCPISIPQSDLNKVSYLVGNFGACPDHWIRDSGYYDKDLKGDRYEAVVIMLPNNKFECEYCDLPVGVQKELRIAYLHKKTLYLAYKNNLGNYNLYTTSFDGITFKGVAGSVSLVKSEIEIMKQDSKPTLFPKVEVTEKKVGIFVQVQATEQYDKRLLLG